MSLPSKQNFVEIIAQHQRLITSLCNLYFCSEEDKKDARQDIILQLWKSFPTFRQESKISTWIYKVSLHTLLYKTRKEKKKFKTESLTNPDVIDIPTSSFADDEVQHLQYAIKQLSDLDKAIVILYLEGFSHKEIATTLHLTETNTSTRFNRIKIRLQKIYKTSPDESRQS